MYRFIVAAAILLLSMVAVRADAGAVKPATITPIFSARIGQRPQPLGGEMRFLNNPTLTRVCSLKVVLVHHRASAEPIVLRIAKGDVYAMPITPDSVVWDAPIDSGASKTFLFSFTPTYVGSHRLSLEKKSDKSWSALGSIHFAINEDGKTICSGPQEECQATLVPPHSRQDTVPIEVAFPINQLVTRRFQDRHFSSVFKFTPGTGFKDSVFVDFELECQTTLYAQVQFQIEHSTNVSVSKLPESWGDKAGPTPDYRFYRGRFAIVPLKSGLSQLTFSVLGKHPMAKGSSRLSTDFAMHLVIGTDGQLLFAGGFDPFTRYKDGADPMLGSLKAILANTDRDFRTRFVLSQPDYRGQEVDARDAVDSTAADTEKKTD